MARHAGVGDKQTNRAYCQNSVQQRSAQNGSNLSTDKLGLFCALFFILRRYELETSLNVAEALAADLAGAGVDPNEAQKALAYLRSKRDGKALFDYLQSVVTNGGVVIRSGRTLGYYRDLQRACQRHLRPLQNDYEQMVLAFGWSLRLLRYYRVVPEAAKEKAEQQRRPAPAPVEQPQPTPARPAGPTMPQVGDIFTGKVLERDENVIIIQVPGFDEEQVFGVLKVEPSVPKYRVGKDSARVEVTGVRTLKSGKTLVEVKRAEVKK